VLLAAAGAVHSLAPAAGPPPAAAVTPRTAHAADTVHRYTVAIDRALTRLDVAACLDGSASSGALAAGSRDAAGLLRISADGGGLEVRRDGSRLRWRDVGDGRCLAYTVDLAAALEQDGWGRARRYGDAVLLRSTQWLWRPRLAEGEDIEVDFQLPDTFDVSVPWLPARGAEATAYRVGPTPAAWPARTAIGRLGGRQTLAVGGARLRLAVLGDVPEATAARWLTEAAGAVASLYGAFPLPSPQVLVMPADSAAEAVPWAQIVRGGGAAALFFVDPTRPLRDLRDDWTATHEFSHLLIPYVARDEAWLSEGLASYYQNVLRARAGMLDERTAWERLEAGFRRGRAEARNGTLARLSAEMYAERAYRHVYWSGAAFWLEADVTLRRESGGSASLDTALGALRECCLPAHGSWSGDRLLQTLDAHLGGSTLTDLAGRYRAGRSFPDVSSLYRELGVRVSGGRVSLDDEAPGARWRRAIMGAAEAATP
jgi:hypothetical protein